MNISLFVAFMNSSTTTLTRKLNTISRDYRYVIRTLAVEKKTLKVFITNSYYLYIICNCFYLIVIILNSFYFFFSYLYFFKYLYFSAGDYSIKINFIKY